jgi:hypothetical protein
LGFGLDPVQRIGLFLKADMSIIDLASWLGSLGRLGVISRRGEMKDAGDNDARPNGNSRAIAPIRPSSGGDYYQPDPGDDFECASDHSLNMHPAAYLFQPGTLP